MARADWDALKRGQGCPMCAGLARADRVDEYGYPVGELALSRLRLCVDQYARGYCVLICHRHGPETYDLAPPEATAFLSDLSLAAGAIATAFSAEKMNLLLLGNAVPHLHAHLIPRYYGDPAPGAPFLPGSEPVRVAEAEYLARAARIRHAIMAG